jgi:uncharacterized lipoprotein NlpE involved in copper resistance
MKTPLAVLEIVNYDLLGCDTRSRGNWFMKFRDKISGFVKDKEALFTAPGTVQMKAKHTFRLSGTTCPTKQHQKTGTLAHTAMRS